MAFVTLRPNYLVLTYLCSMKSRSFLLTQYILSLVTQYTLTFWFLQFAYTTYYFQSHVRTFELFLCRRGGTFDACRRH